MFFFGTEGREANLREVQAFLVALSVPPEKQLSLANAKGITPWLIFVSLKQQ